MLQSKYVRMELLKLSNAQLDTMCSDAQDAAEASFDAYDFRLYNSLAEACADILADRRIIPSSWNAFYSPEDGSWSLFPGS